MLRLKRIYLFHVTLVAGQVVVVSFGKRRVEWLGLPTIPNFLDFPLQNELFQEGSTARPLKDV